MAAIATEQRRKKVTPATHGLGLYNAWQKTCTQQNPKGDSASLKKLTAHIARAGGYNKAGVSEFRATIQSAK